VDTAEIVIKVGQLWRRRLDGRRFIPARRVTDGWLDLVGIKRTECELRQNYTLVPLDDDMTRFRRARWSGKSFVREPTGG
jgi:hypothetical protein